MLLSVAISSCSKISTSREAIAQDEVVGPAIFASDCTSQHQDLIAEALDRLAQAAASNAFRECVTEKINTEYGRCVTSVAGGVDPIWAARADATTIERALQIVSSANRLQILACDGTHPHFGKGPVSEWEAFVQVAPGGFGHTNSETMTFNIEAFDIYASDVAEPVCPTRVPSASCKWRGQPYARMASTIVHETLHNHGFFHDCSTTDPIGGTNMTWIVQDCMSSVIIESSYACDFDVSTCNGGKGRYMIASYNGVSRNSNVQCTCVEPHCFDFADVDMDGIGDACDLCPSDPLPDTDRDGICTGDNCPGYPDPTQLDQDSDGLGNVCDSCVNDATPDLDRDGVCTYDNCPTGWNPMQYNIDGDSLGNKCDPDMDNDGYFNHLDNCPYDYNPDQADQDGDDSGDLCDCLHYTFGQQYLGDCSPQDIRYQNILKMDQLLVAIAHALGGFGSGPYGPWTDLESCKWPCPDFDPKETAMYAAALDYVANRLYSSPYGFTELDIYMILASDPLVTDDHMETYKAARFGEAW
jgi:hypothetical protein